MFLALAARAQENQLKDIHFSTLPGDKLQMRFVFTAGAVEPKVFHTDNPARIVLDFPGVRNGLIQKSLTVNTGIVTQVNVIEGGGRTRVVVNLVAPVPYRVESEGEEVHLLLESVGAVATTVTRPAAHAALPTQRIEKVDFRRGPQGEGRILVFLAQPNTLVDLREEGGKVIATFLRTRLPSKLAKVLDVMDFATPVKQIKIFQDGPNVRMMITPATPDYEYLSYQSDRLLTIEFRPLTQAQKEEKKKKFPYTGERLSLNFQDIPVRSVLQILADFTGLNIIAADTVKGNVTLRLNNVPWDQALDLVLKAKGLGKRREGNVIWVAPLDEIIKLEKKELEHVQFRQQKEPLKTEIVQLNYAKAADVMKVLKGMQQSGGKLGQQGVPEHATTFEEAATAGEESIAGGSILSPRGEVNIDERTNILIVKDTPTNLEAVRKLVRTLDRPVRQVLIESRVVIAEDGFNRELGVKLNAAKQSGSPGDTQTIIGGILGNNNGIVDLPAAIGTGAGGGMGIAIFKLNKFLMQLELSALQAENRGDVLSMPRVVTQDQTKASIEQGVEIPFQTVSQNGTQTQFKKAVLKLEVTPHITPDDNVIMDLLVKKDAPGDLTPDGVAINKREIRTTVQVANGETVVLGGVYEKDRRKTVNKVPFFGDLPGFAFMFRKDGKSSKKNELLIFITPKVLESTRL
ncbi:type IV pilus secretin PilQ [Methylomarinovum tepidoasis]|uniref:type IV pilus secretin PilQ n=1 Tax=Methylomarinovum tepidoasis TaxID=2840183 RepID=UPI0025730265|nr:type IV pilus secretin PilQ [Methylomarinovum sp. IN45]